jgi:FkbH-like protein
MLDLNTCEVDAILMHRRTLRAELLSRESLKQIRVAILGSTTTSELVNFLEISLLYNGFRPIFYQSDFGRYYEEAVLDPRRIIEFRPDIIYLHTSCLDVLSFPRTGGSESEIAKCLQAEMNRLIQIWDALECNVGCQVIQNNFETPPYAILGNLDAVSPGGKSRFLLELNIAMAHTVAKRTKVIMQDVHGLSARVGLNRWFDWKRFWSYKLLLTAEANLSLARSLNALVLSIYGKSRKVLILDLDNTLWGGVIGDDGLDRIQIGRETPVAESYSAFQEYCLSLRDRGILLAVCSKNTESTARSAFEHPSSVLKAKHFSSFKANWLPKHENILAIAAELSLGIDSFVFIDDNPAEREIVRAQLPQVAVPEVGSDVSHFAEIIEGCRYFETHTLSHEDLDRASLYADNFRRAEMQQRFATYGEYLDSLEMVAEIDVFKSVYLERIAQLTNKTNQFNLTTRRYTPSEIEAMATDRRFIALYGRLKDRFGDNGLITVLVGRREGKTLHLDLWLMSCRVLKRDMEYAMLDALIVRALASGIESIVGYFVPSPKNAMVADFYGNLGFRVETREIQGFPENTQSWRLDLAGYQPRTSHITITDYSYASSH